MLNNALEKLSRANVDAEVEHHTQHPRSPGVEERRKYQLKRRIP
jgi:hypothetical protein